MFLPEIVIAKGPPGDFEATRHQPLAGGIGHSRRFLLAEPDDDLLSRLGSAPDIHILGLLEDHAIGNKRVWADVGAGRPSGKRDRAKFNNSVARRSGIRMSKLRRLFSPALLPLRMRAGTRMNPRESAESPLCPPGTAIYFSPNRPATCRRGKFEAENSCS